MHKNAIKKGKEIFKIDNYKDRQTSASTWKVDCLFQIGFFEMFFLWMYVRTYRYVYLLPTFLHQFVRIALCSWLFFPGICFE